MSSIGKISITVFFITMIVIFCRFCNDWWLWKIGAGPAWECSGEKYIVLALAFTHDGLLNQEVPVPPKKVVVDPGEANRKLADWLKSNARCFSTILTQRAISDVWLENGELVFPEINDVTEKDCAYLKGTGTRVYQMHKHNPHLASVRTLEALDNRMVSAKFYQTNLPPGNYPGTH